MRCHSRHEAELTWEIPDSNSSGFSPLGFTILALVLNMAFVSGEKRKDTTFRLQKIKNP